MDEIFGGVLGGVVGRGGDGVGILGETKEAVIGGCWGLLMSAAFFFFFFAGGMAWLFGVPEFELQITSAAAPVILALCASGFASPIVGVMLGLQGGRYSVTRHIGCFIIYLGLLLGAIVLLTLGL